MWKRERIELRVTDEGWARKVELLAAGTPASWLWVSRQTWRIGSAPVRMGGIGGVYTEPKFRFRGYAARCMARAVEDMREQGVPTSHLFGIGDFYHRWGYASVMPEPRLVIATRAAERAGDRRGFRVRAFRPGRDAAAVLRIYAAANASRSGSSVRAGPKAWRKFKMGSSWGRATDDFVVTDLGGRVAGYASCDESATGVTVNEAAASTPRAYAAITAELARRAVARREGEVAMLLPPDDPYAAFLRRHDCRHTLAWFRAANGMARLISLDGTLRACAGELTLRLRASPREGGPAAVALATDLGTAVLRARRGRVVLGGSPARVPRIRLPQWALMQLLLGSRSVDELRDEGVLTGPRRPDPLLRALFPPGVPYMYQSDRF